MLLENNSPRKSTRMLKVGLAAFAVISLIGVCMFVSSSKSAISSIIEAEEHEFRSYMNKFSKSYSESEYLTRFQNFRDNQVFIRKFNSDQSDVILAANLFADMTFEEFKSKYLKPKTLKASPVEIIDLDLEAANSTVDWRAKGVLTPVKNQGQCGSCWAFSATGAIEAAWAIAHKKVVSLSEQQLVACSTGMNQGCDGGYASEAFKYVIENGGINTEVNYPYLGKDSTCNKTLEEEKVVNITSSAGVLASNYKALMAAVTNQPTSTGVEANVQWMHYSSGIITQRCGINLNHDTLTVGYDSTAAVPYWIVKNSWGTSWGIEGYIQIAMSPGVGVCGINMDAYYPIV